MITDTINKRPINNKTGNGNREDGFQILMRHAAVMYYSEMIKGKKHVNSQIYAGLFNQKAGSHIKKIPENATPA